MKFVPSAGSLLPATADWQPALPKLVECYDRPAASEQETYVP